MKIYEFQLVIEEGCDESWEEQPTPKQLVEWLKDDLEGTGWNAKLKFLGTQDADGQTQMDLD
jgi:hypothetical protein